MIRLPAIRGHMGEREYFTTSVGMGELLRIVRYQEDNAPVNEAFSRQRKLNLKRVKNEMVPYLQQNSDHFYNSLVVEHLREAGNDHAVRFQPLEGQGDIGWVELDGTETLETLDGQHRLKSIEMAIKDCPSLRAESISLVIVPHKDVASSQQMFSDLNRYAKHTSKSQTVVFDHRGPVEFWTKQLAKRSDYLRGRVNMSGTSSSKAHITTASTLFDAINILKPLLPAGDDREANALALQDYFDVAFKVLPGFEKDVQKNKGMASLKGDYLYAHPIGFLALAEVIKGAVNNYPMDWRDFLTDAIPAVGWELTNPQWEGIAIVAGRIMAGGGPRYRTATFIKWLLGLPVDIKQLEDMKSIHEKMGKALPEPIRFKAGLRLAK